MLWVSTDQQGDTESEREEDSDAGDGAFGGLDEWLVVAAALASRVRLEIRQSKWKRRKNYCKFFL